MTQIPTLPGAGAHVTTRCELPALTPDGASVHARRGVAGVVIGHEDNRVRIAVHAGERLVMTLLAHPDQLRSGAGA